MRSVNGSQFSQRLERFPCQKRVGVAFERNTTDHPFLPTKGTYVGALWSTHSKALGGDYNLFKQEYHVGVYEPLFWKFVGHVRGEIGFESAGRPEQLSHLLNAFSSEE